MAYRFHHVHVICRDLDGMIDFFTNTLGAGLVEKKKFGPADGAVIDVAGVTVNLRVPRQDEAMLEDASKTSYGFDHIGLKVDDIRQAYSDLTEKGFKFFMPPRDVGAYVVAFFKGPENLTIELLQTKH